MDADTRWGPVRVFTIQVVAILVIFTIGGFFAMYLRTQQLLSAQALAQARSYARLVLATRLWNAHYEGVWVEKRPGVESNPYLRSLGVDPDIRTADGRTLTLRNPALMTREISEAFVDRTGVSFRLTSDRPVNPANAPSDAWERAALTAFTRGTLETWETTGTDGRHVLRYMRPMRVTSQCLPCHARQGYRRGDIRGGLIVAIPLAPEAEILRVNAVWLVVAALLSMLVLVVLTRYLVGHMTGRLEEAESALVRMATTDDLTALSNRRAILERLREEAGRAARERRPLGVTILDLDHFKLVNDTHGHAAGDRVLVEAASRMRIAVREYDSLGRIGGEEFLVVSPGVDAEAALALAERVREAVGSEPVEFGGVAIRLSVSAGVTLIDPATGSDPVAEVDRALGRADDALYAAKEAGRDRVALRLED